MGLMIKHKVGVYNSSVIEICDIDKDFLIIRAKF